VFGGYVVERNLDALQINEAPVDESWKSFYAAARTTTTIRRSF
jgi:hypothetical protein